ncbi:MAG: hypothetical protein AAGE96_17600 [Cyanobacteria bacterium P01_G01_bin.19]
MTKASDRYMDILRRTQEYRKDLHYWKSYYICDRIIQNSPHSLILSISLQS